MLDYYISVIKGFRKRFVFSYYIDRMLLLLNVNNQNYFDL